MRIPNEKIENLKRKIEKQHKDIVIGWELQGRGIFCPHCKSFDLEHDNKYPRFTGTAIIMMTKCLSCGFLFDKPEEAPAPYVVFRTANGIFPCPLELTDIDDKTCNIIHAI